MHLQWLLPTWAWLPLLLAAAAWAVWVRRVYGRTVPAPTMRVRRLLVGLRTAAGLVVLLAVARPLLITEQTVDDPAVVAVVVEDSGSMALQDGADRPTRWRQALAVAASVDSLLAAADTGAEFVLLRGNGLADLRQTTLAEARQDTPRAVGSDLPSLVTEARQRLLARPLRGLVVLSDGHSDRGQATGQPGRTPLWLVGVGDRSGVADRGLVDLRHPDAVHVGEPLVVELAVRQRGATTPDDSVTVSLRRGDEVLDRRTGPARDLSRWELTWTPDAPGLAVLQVDVSPLEGERFLGNNQATLAVDVAKERARVLLLAPHVGWNVRFLAQAALAEPRLQVRVVRPGPEGPVFADDRQPWQAPLSAADWRDDWEAVVLAGPPGAWLPDDGRELAGAVRQGLGLLVLALDADVVGEPRPWSGPLADLLPVVPGGGRVRTGEFAVQVADAGRGHPLLADLIAAGGLAALPPLQAVLPVQLRAGARPLLVSDTSPVLVAAEPGSGRLLWFGARRLWELAFWQPAMPSTADDHAGRRLLRQLLLWTALGDQRGGVSLLGRQRVFEAGEPVPVAVRWRDLRGDPVTDRGVTVEVRREGEAAGGQPYALRPEPTRPGEFSGVLPLLPPGRWQLVPRGEGDPPQPGEPRTVAVTAAESERAQVRQDWRNLRQTGSRLGAMVLDAGQPNDRQVLLDALADLALDAERAPRQARLEPTATWAWLGLVVVLLGAEWLVRRRQGLL
ncbi:MAG: hypothetical protein R3D98_08775 [Candidatus Krumholzibacteriia bacterium]